MLGGRVPACHTQEHKGRSERNQTGSRRLSPTSCQHGAARTNDEKRRQIDPWGRHERREEYAACQGKTKKPRSPHAPTRHESAFVAPGALEYRHTPDDIAAPSVDRLWRPSGCPRGAVQPRSISDPLEAVARIGFDRRIVNRGGHFRRPGLVAGRTRQSGGRTRVRVAVRAIRATASLPALWDTQNPPPIGTLAVVAADS